MDHNKDLTFLSQKLRKNMTKEEKHLWYDFLKKHPVQFKRQVTCGQYILDFYCPKAKLAIELDGEYHRAIERSDKTRDEYLNSLGILVIRYKNKEIWENFLEIRDQIGYMVKKRTESTDEK